MNKSHLTTFQTAKILSVSPDAVLKWIKSGKIKAYRTPGGHYRILRKDIESLLKQTEMPTDTLSESSKNPIPYCWEYNGQKNCNKSDCADCIVYRSQAMKCYEMSFLPAEYGHLKRFCKSSCLSCEYYNMTITSHLTFDRS